MTRITAISSSVLTHQKQRLHLYERRALPHEETAETNKARHHGNRRMGDRRGNERRAGGRRAADHQNAHTVASWCSAQFGAHLIGQAESEALVTASRVSNAYGCLASYQIKRGEMA